MRNFHTLPQIERLHRHAHAHPARVYTTGPRLSNIGAAGKYNALGRTLVKVNGTEKAKHLP